MAMRIDILSLFPNYFKGPFDESIIKQARKKGLLDIRLIDIRDFASNEDRRADDRPYGGGPGMVMMPEPVEKAISSVKTSKAKVVYLSPQGSPLTAAKCRELAASEHLILLCGHYEGIDERVLTSLVDEEISIGDYVLTNGCLPAIVIVDAVVRFIPGILGHDQAAYEDSFEQEILDCPHYTRPEIFKDVSVPAVLLSGDHLKIKKWRLSKALAKTAKVRPDLFLRYVLTKQESEEKPNKNKRQGIKFKGFSQTTLFVSELKRSVRFYKDVLGLEIISQGSASATLSLPGQRLSLIEVEDVMSACKLKPRFELEVNDDAALNVFARKVSAECVISNDEEPKFKAIEFKDPDGYLWCIRRT